ncbi:transmembrane protein 80 isoform X3 [Macaca mulatta]
MRSGFGAALGDPVPDSSCPARGFCEDTWAGWARGFGSLGTFAKETAGARASGVLRERLASERRKGQTKAVNRPCCRGAAFCCLWVQPERSNAGAEVPHLRARSLEIRSGVQLSSPLPGPRSCSAVSDGDSGSIAVIPGYTPMLDVQ